MPSSLAEANKLISSAARCSIRTMPVPTNTSPFAGEHGPASAAAKHPIGFGSYAMARGRLFSNILWSTSGALVNALAGLVTLPFLVSRLGTESYGLWTLIVAVSGYIMALEL